VVRGAGGGARLEGTPDVEDGVEVVAGERRHPGPAVRRRLDEALGGEAGQRLPHRGAREAQALRELDLAEVGAGGEVAGEDRLAQVGQRALGRAPRPSFDRRRHDPPLRLYAT
jgi:hypothetical protein